jgi:hypothetical protein
LALVVSAAGPVAAQQPQPTVVELFTSQGCSSCPPADALFAELVQQPSVIGLAWHVDYWDYIGWADTFGAPAHTERQKAYATARGEKMVYTPQMVVNGTLDVVGSDPADVAMALQTGPKVSGADVTLSRDGTSLEVDVRADTALADGATVELVHFVPEQTVSIERGENAGRALSYSNIVVGWQRLALWDGREALNLRLEVSPDLGVAVLIQDAATHQILGAAMQR